ncbi:MAG TPA: histidine kinase [Actinomycetota bacterium]
MRGSATSTAVRLLSWALALAAVVALSFGVLVLLFGRVPSDAERGLLVPAVAAIAFGALVVAASYGRVGRAIARVTRGERGASADLARSFSSRMSRAIPLDELVLQAAEGLRSTLGLRSAEVWVAAEGSLRPWIGDPGVDRPPVPLGGMDPATVVQAGLSGHGWLQVWMPQMLDGRERSYVRLAPMANAGELQGVVVVDRPVDDPAFTPDEERTVVEVARQLGVVLHNAKLDSALQASLDEVRRQAAELQASRGRIVAAADAARREIERNLHDGAQQHLVALAVRVKLASQLLDRDPRQAHAALDEVGTAIDDALQELRDLAHGIYPPVLADQGLRAALESAASRSTLPVAVRANDLPRVAPEYEATVYFCVLEALQNAGKYAGKSASVTVEVREEEGSLVFAVSDDGAGFDVMARGAGAGFTNMLDRLGALGGTLRVESAPGKGTRVVGALPATAASRSKEQTVQ